MFGIRRRIMCSVKSWTEAEQSPKAVRAWPVHIRARGRGRRRLRSPGQRRGKKSETEAGSSWRALPTVAGTWILCRCGGSRVQAGFSRGKVPSDLGSQKAALASPWIWTVEGRVAWKGLARQLPWSSRGS